eukprot:6475601-Amphidinium_carterae.2
MPIVSCRWLLVSAHLCFPSDATADWPLHSVCSGSSSTPSHGATATRGVAPLSNCAQTERTPDTARRFYGRH